MLEALNYSVTGEGALLGLRLAMNCDGHLGELGLSRLRLHLAGERYISQMLYLCSAAQPGEHPADSAGRPWAAAGWRGRQADVVPPDGRAVQPVGFAEDEALIPYPLNTFRGYRYLRGILRGPGQVPVRRRGWP
ncbi:type VI secretion system baseplate subunit TssF [Pseudomonas aeruginosa]|nr:type VI secretion system baseplate subunit TssF [Pseudomonas aeruginosa]